MNRTNEQLAHDHAHHAPQGPSDIDMHQAVRARTTELAQWVNSALPDGREKSIALTKLDEARMWANAAVALKRPATTDG
ncbi:MAG: hypothetical protein AAF196_09050 [Planctomycetota bacterium]